VADVFSNPTDTEASPVVETGSKPSFLKSPAGIIVAVAVVVVLLIAAGLAVYFFLFSGGAGGDASPTVKTITTGSAKPGSVAASVTLELPVTEPQDKPLESTFSFRNIFAPTVKRPVAVVVQSSSSSTATLNVPADTLYLVSIDEVNGERMASFIWNDATYQLGEGDTISGTPWKVLDIRSDSVVMLFGDTEVTLTVGQGLSK
jgi:hypothetical protein